MKKKNDSSTQEASSTALAGYAPQRWSAEKPKAAGWWWYRHSPSHSTCVLRVFWDEDDKTLSVRTGDYADQTNFLENFDGQWGWPGPLPEPLDAPDAETGHIDKLSD